MLILTVSGCGTGLDPIDNLTQPAHTCEYRFTVTNNSSQPVHIHMDLAEDVMDARCSSDQDHQNNTVPPGTTAVVKANLSCRNCYVQEAYTVDACAPSVNFKGFRSSGEAGPSPGDVAATCTDSGCTGN